MQVRLMIAYSLIALIVIGLGLTYYLSARKLKSGAVVEGREGQPS